MNAPAVPCKPIATPDAWLGADLWSRSDWIDRLPAEDIAELHAALGHRKEHRHKLTTNFGNPA